MEYNRIATIIAVGRLFNHFALDLRELALFPYLNDLLVNIFKR